MELRQFGASPLKVTALGFGAMHINDDRTSDKEAGDLTMSPVTMPSQTTGVDGEKWVLILKIWTGMNWLFDLGLDLDDSNLFSFILIYINKLRFYSASPN